MNTSMQNEYSRGVGYASKNGQPTSLAGMVLTFKKNFLERQVEIVPGLLHNQYEIVKRVYFYQHNQFISGPTDENGDPKYFYDLITFRNDQATKNIDLDTKDCYIQSETQDYLRSWMLRREYMQYAKTTQWGKKLNELADDLPDMGTVVWKKFKDFDGTTDVKAVELINLMCDPTVKELRDGLTIERHIMTRGDVLKMKGRSWDATEVDKILDRASTVPNSQFLDSNMALNRGAFNYVDTMTQFYEFYELWGEIPRSLFERYRTDVKVSTTDDYSDVDPNETVKVMAIISGVEDGGYECVPFCQEVDDDMFPYKEVHYRRRKGRWLGVGNFEQCFDLIEKANEITNRFFASLRIALLHLYQTRDTMHVKNVLTDLLDGDVIVSKSAIEIIPTEIRGFTQYKEEIDRIERHADQLCNSYEVVTGESLPSGTPFKLGAQQLQSANLLFKYVRQNMSLFIENVFNEWLLKGFAEKLTPVHILELMDDLDDIKVYYDAKRKMYQYEVLKRYILETGQMPDPAALDMAGSLMRDQIAKGSKQVEVEMAYYKKYKYSIKMVIDGENDRKKENLETLSNTFQVVAANPAALQDERLMRIMNMILEQSGFSPAQLNAVNQTPTNPTLNPSMQGGAGPGRGGGSAGAPAAPVAVGATK